MTTPENPPAFPLPIIGMKRIPALANIEAGIGYPGFIGCLFWAAQQAECLDQFNKDTGLNLRSVIQARGINSMIDESTGYKAKTIAAFADWVCENVWGEEELLAERAKRKDAL